MQKNRLSLVGGGMGGGYTTTRFSHYYQHYYYIGQFYQYNAIVKFYEFPIYTTIQLYTLLLTINQYQGKCENGTLSNADKRALYVQREGKKLLILRVSGILVSSQPCKPPFFRFAPPLLIFFGEWCIIIFATILYWYLDGVIIDKSTEIYNNATAEN